MPKNQRLTITLIAVATSLFAVNVSAQSIKFTLDFPGGFNVSINNGALIPSGPITVIGLLDDSTTDISADPSNGEFPLTSVTFSGAGFTNRAVTTPLSLVTFFSDKFGFQRTGEFNEGIIGWNGPTSSGIFMNDVNDLSTLVALPYTTSGESTFWYDALGVNSWTLALGGDTIGANIGNSGPTGLFSISRVPEPSTVVMSVMGLLTICYRRKTRT